MSRFRNLGPNSLSPSADS